MFGERYIIGEFEGKITSKTRIVIPKFTYVQSFDELVIQLVNIDSELALKVYAYKMYQDILNRYKKLGENATTIEEFERINQKIEEISKSLNSKVITDKQRRIIIPKITFNQLNWKEDDTLSYEGLGNSLLIRKKS